MSSFTYLLDTNILSDLIRHPAGKIMQRIEAVGEARVCTSVVVAAELRLGACKKGSPRLTRQVDVVLSALDILPLEQSADERYARLRTALEKAGTPIGPNDMIIAAHVLDLGLILVTTNVREFSSVPGLILENWLT